MQQQGDAYVRQSFGAVPPSPNTLVSWFSQFARNADCPATQTVNGRPRLPSLLAFSFYAGDLRLYRDRVTNVGQGEVMHLRDVPRWQPRAGAIFADVLRTEFLYKPDCQGQHMGVLVEEAGLLGLGAHRVLWRGVTKPDGLIAPLGAQQGDWFELVSGETLCGRRLKQRSIARSVSLQGCEPQKSQKGVWERLKASTVPLPRLVLQVLAHRCAVFYDLSAGSGRTPDSVATVLQILAAGVILSVAREGRARALAAQHAAQPGFNPAGLEILNRLRDPIFIVGTPQNTWKGRTNTPEQPRCSRVWSFVYTDFGIRINRSKGLTIPEMMEYVRAGVYA